MKQKQKQWGGREATKETWVTKGNEITNVLRICYIFYGVISFIFCEKHLIY